MSDPSTSSISQGYAHRELAAQEHQAFIETGLGLGL